MRYLRTIAKAAPAKPVVICSLQLAAALKQPRAKKEEAVRACFPPVLPEMVLIPVNAEDHWWLLIAYTEGKQLVVYDSIPKKKLHTIGVTVKKALERDMPGTEWALDAAAVVCHLYSGLFRKVS